MVSSLSGALTPRFLANVYTKSSFDFSKAAEKIASGKKASRPADDIGTFIRSQEFNAKSKDLQRVQRSIAEAISVLDVASTAGKTIAEDLQRMKELTEIYWHPTTDTNTQTAVEAEFNQRALSVQNLISSARYNNIQLIQDSVSGGTPVWSVSLSPDGISNQMDIDFGATDIADTSALDITDTDEATVLAAVEEQYGRAMSYLAKVSAYEKGLQSQYAIADTTDVSYQQADDALNSIDEGQQMTEMVTYQMRLSMSVAMMSQDNARRSGVLQLFAN